MITREQYEQAKSALGALRYELDPDVWRDVEASLRPLMLLAKDILDRPIFCTEHGWSLCPDCIEWLTKDNRIVKKS